MAWATVTGPCTFRGKLYNNNSYAWGISGLLGGMSTNVESGTSCTFNGQTIKLENGNSVKITGTFNFKESNDFTDITTGSQVTIELYSSHYWFYGATVKTLSDASVTGCTVNVSSDNHTVTVIIPSGKTFGNIYLDFVDKAPMPSNTTVTVPAGDYWVSNNSHRPTPDPTVTYNGTTLVKGTDYTVSWSNNSSAGTGTVTVSGTGQYAGTATGTFPIRWATYKVHFDKNHSDATGTMPDQNFTYNTAQALTANAFYRNYYSVEGWSVMPQGSLSYTDQQSVENLIAEDNATFTLYAKWTPVSYAITYDLAGGSEVTANPESYNIETASFTLNNPTRQGYTFAGWTGTGLSDVTETVTIATGSTGERSYTAHWTPTDYIISYNLMGGEVETANPTSYNIETASFTLNNPTRLGYTFAGWTGTGLSEATQTVTIETGSTGQRSYTAKWTPVTYNITYDLAGGSEVTANPTTYNIEKSVTLKKPTRQGYYFAGWTGTGLNEATRNVYIAKGSIGDRHYTANWAQVWGQENGADGTEERPYIITTPEGLIYLADEVNGGNDMTGTFFELGADIVFSHTSNWDDNTSTESNYIPIGDGTKVNGYLRSFRGTFDGNNKTVSGIRYKNSDYENSGLFGHIGGVGTVKNVTISDTRISGKFNYPIGGIVGNNQGTVYDCHVTSTVNILGRYYTGGIAGYNNGTIGNCTSASVLGNPAGYNGFGGIAGTNNNIIRNCFVSGGSIPEAEKYVGAIVGEVYSSSSLSSNYYSNCTIADIANATDKGVGSEDGGVEASSDQTDNDGARGVGILTLGENITATGQTVVIGGTTYYYAGQTITLAPATDGDSILSAQYNDGANHKITPVEGVYSFTMPAADVTVSAVSNPAEQVSYIDENGKAKTAMAVSLTGNETEIGMWGEDMWYSVDSDITYDHQLILLGNVHLILCDGKTMTVNATITGTNSSGYCINGENGYLSIYGQSGGTGALTVENEGSGGGIFLAALTINGGHIKSTAKDNALYAAYEITINDGVVTAESSGKNSIVSYNPDTDTYITINGGVVTATSNGDRAIYCYSQRSNTYITINGGKVTATGVVYGIFGNGFKSSVDILGGQVKAYSIGNGSTGNINLGYTNASDYIEIETINSIRFHVTIVSGQIMTDGTNTYSGYLSTAQRDALAGKTLRPCGEPSVDLTLVQGEKDGVTCYWGTFYYGVQRYTLPEGAAAYTMNADKNLYRLGSDGSVIPAGVAVVIIAEKSDITLTKSDETSEIAIHGGGNILRGSDSNIGALGGKITVGGQQKTPCVLGKVGETVSFYPLSSSFNEDIPANKAYYVIEDTP